MNEPLLTVITINRDMGDRPARTIASLNSQTEPFRWVVIDGASRDVSVELLRAALRPGDHFISEPDEGIADAFNKGLALVSSGAVIFLNAGDAFTDPTALARLAGAWRSGHPWVMSGARVLNESGHHLYSRCYHPGTGVEALLRRGCRIFHAATLVDHALFERHGHFDCSFRISMDYEFWLRLMAAGHAPEIIPGEVGQFFVGGTSSHVGCRMQEERRARNLHGITNSQLVEWGLGAVVVMKQLARPFRSPVFYRLKEFLRL